MAQDGFSQAAKKPYELGVEGRAVVRGDLQRYLGMADENCDALINDIELTGGLRQFGYGSLIGDPSSENDKEYSGTAQGWEKGAFCKDRHYRGTPEKLGVTMGALPTSDGEGGLQGVVQEINADDGDGDFVSRVRKNIRDFAKREVSLNPIYEYNVIDITKRNGDTVKAMICAADSKNPLYLGRDGENGGLTLEEKAAIIATSIGVQGETNTSPRTTGMAYWRDHVKCCELGGFEVDPAIKELIELAEVYRADLEQTDPELFATLTAIEAKTGPTGAELGVSYATPVYDVAVVSASEDPRTVIQLRDDAIENVDLLTDPLTPAHLKHLEVLKAELEEPTFH